MYRTIIVLSLLAACNNDGKVPDVNVNVIPGDPVVITNTITETNTETNTVTETVTVPAVDADGDSFPAEIDCDDSDPARNPAADEYCDSVDNDCNGLVDDEAVDAVTLFPDLDADGFGYTPWPYRSCSVLPGYSLTSGDCNDVADYVFPGADEIYDGVDNDCDSVVDTFDQDYETPILEMSYDSWMGDMIFERGATSVWLGNLVFDPTEPMRIEEFTVLTYVDSDPGALFGGYTPVSEDGIAFSDHFTDCVMKDINGTVVAGPMDPDPNGTILFTDSFHIDTRMIFDVECDHTGLWPAGEYDGFSIDIPWDWSMIVAVADTGAPVTEETGNENGRAHPSTRRILRDSICTFDIELFDGSIVQMHTETELTQNAATPSGAGFVPGYQEVTRFNVHNLHAGCSDAVIEGLTIWVSAADNAGTSWNTNIPVGLVDPAGTVIASGVGAHNTLVPLTFSHAIPAGGIHTFQIWADTSGASSADDDSINILVMGWEIDWSDTAQSVENSQSQFVTGGTLVF